MFYDIACSDTIHFSSHSHVIFMKHLFYNDCSNRFDYRLFFYVYMHKLQNLKLFVCKGHCQISTTINYLELIPTTIFNWLYWQSLWIVQYFVF